MYCVNKDHYTLKKMKLPYTHLNVSIVTTCPRAFVSSQKDTLSCPHFFAA